MPIFEYVCKKCEHRFEVIVQGSRTPECPACKSQQLEKQLSVFAARGRTSEFDAGMSAAPCGTCGDPRGPGACSLN
jgi:putative FmdB family regulatory protein